MGNQDINLLKQQSSPVGNFVDFAQRAKTIAWWGLVSFLIVGVLVGSAFLYAQGMVALIKKTNEGLSARIRAQQNKEGILVSLKERAGVAQKSLNAVRPWGILFPLLLKMGTQEQYVAFQVDILGKVTTQFELSRIEEAIAIVKSVMAQENEKTIKSSELTSLNIRNDGTVTMAISFQPIF